MVTVPNLVAIWSSLRLVPSLAAQQRVSQAGIIGAFAGYQMLGLICGLFCIAPESIRPGSLHDQQHSGSTLLQHGQSNISLGQPV